MWLLAAPLIVLAAVGSIAHPSETRIKDYVRAEMARRRIPGLALLVARNHRVVLAANFGLASLERKQPVTDSTEFEIASMSKQFTDAAVLLLVERGQLASSDHLSQHLPDLPPAWQAITLEQLMNHTSGLRDDWDEPDSFFTTRTTQGFLEALKAAPLKFEPGSDWSYGCGPFLLGLVIQRVAGRSYPEFMRESIFEPLGLSSTRVNDSASVASAAATGYVIRQGELRTGIRISPAAEARADVGIRSTARDLARWDAALDDTSLLSARSRERMFTPARLTNGDPTPYGLGWFITPFRGHTEVEHGGGFRTGFSSVIARYPDDRLTVIVLTNLQSAHAYSIARGVAAFYDDAYRSIATMRPRADPDSSRTQTVARILAAIRDGRVPAELLPGVLRLTTWSLDELRSELAKASPPTFIDYQPLAHGHALAFGTPIVENRFYRTSGDKPRFWTFSFAADGRVAYFELEE